MLGNDLVIGHQKVPNNMAVGKLLAGSISITSLAIASFVIYVNNHRIRFKQMILLIKIIKYQE